MDTAMRSSEFLKDKGCVIGYSDCHLSSPWSYQNMTYTATIIFSWPKISNVFKEVSETCKNKETTTYIGNSSIPQSLEGQ